MILLQIASNIALEEMERWRDEERERGREIWSGVTSEQVSEWRRAENGVAKGLKRLKAIYQLLKVYYEELTKQIRGF